MSKKTALPFRGKMIQIKMSEELGSPRQTSLPSKMLS